MFGTSASYLISCKTLFGIVASNFLLHVRPRLGHWHCTSFLNYLNILIDSERLKGQSERMNI
ncbi:hypothetical protein F383_32140 [Gossypium arboreum]|uniref:Uncharacterized protein n=1 Tax=Gossypium arboreum TaxID=29729 RepID=A0A0B0MWE2_GOSAR|nr:hypothetical protein F383_32140 [Gossypium arboreum]